MAPGRGLGLLDRGPDWDSGTVGAKAESTSTTWTPPLASPVQQGKRLISRVGTLLLRGWSTSPTSAPRELRRTAYLDGLRGFAALLVYWQHHVGWAHSSKEHTAIIEHSWGTADRFYFCTLPGVRLLVVGGHLAVSTFFVISGYVLSTKPMALIQAREQAKLADNIASALFRRWLRLYIPLVVTTFVFMNVWSLSGMWVGSMEHHEGGHGEEMWRWYTELKNLSFVFNMGGGPWFQYNPHLWSIPVEFKGSIVVYTACLALSRATRSARLWAQVALIFYFMYIADGWYCAMFVAGMLQSDLDLLATKGELPRWMAGLEPVKKFIYGHLFAFAIYLGGVPSFNSEMAEFRQNRGWYYLSLLKPQAFFDYKWFYLFFAANFVVASTPRLPPLKRFFETRFCQYLGRISYGLYLCHGPVIWLLGDRLYAAVGWHELEVPKNLPGWVDAFRLPRIGPFGMELNFLAPHIIFLPLTLWLADLVTRFVDEPSVRFAQSLYARTLPPKPVKAVAGP